MSTRHAEERIPMLDDAGNRVVVIKTIVYQALLRSIGPVEIEGQRWYTAPGMGHVSRLSDSEFEVFRGHIKLRTEASIGNADSA